MKTVKRKAEVGEQILITNPQTLMSSRKGEVYTVLKRKDEDCVDLRELPFTVFDQEYQVIIEDETNGMTVQDLQMHVSAMVQAERRRQNAKWGHQRHDMLRWLSILVEEVGEVAEAMQKGMPSEKATDAADLMTELIQVAAVAQAIAEQVYEEMHGRGLREWNEL